MEKNTVPILQDKNLKKLQNRKPDLVSTCNLQKEKHPILTTKNVRNLSDDVPVQDETASSNKRLK